MSLLASRRLLSLSKKVSEKEPHRAKRHSAFRCISRGSRRKPFEPTPTSTEAQRGAVRGHGDSRAALRRAPGVWRKREIPIGTRRGMPDLVLVLVLGFGVAPWPVASHWCLTTVFSILLLLYCLLSFLLACFLSRFRYLSVLLQIESPLK